MKFLKMSSLIAAAIAALLAFAATGVASATTLTGEGGKTLEKGTTVNIINGEGERITVHQAWNPKEVTCRVTLKGKTSNTGSSTETVKVALETVDFAECQEMWFNLVQGTLEFHTSGTEANNNGVLTSTGTEWTTELNGIHCIYKTSNTKLGTITGSATTKSNAILDIEATIPRTGGRSSVLCGSSAEWTGTLTFQTPNPLNID